MTRGPKILYRLSRSNSTPFISDGFDVHLIVIESNDELELRVLRVFAHLRNQLRGDNRREIDALGITGLFLSFPFYPLQYPLVNIELN
jgi:hypothetical protein